MNDALMQAVLKPAAVKSGMWPADATQNAQRRSSTRCKSNALVRELLADGDFIINALLPVIIEIGDLLLIEDLLESQPVNDSPGGGEVVDDSSRHAYTSGMRHSGRVDGENAIAKVRRRHHEGSSQQSSLCSRDDGTGW
jgi:hypothetical protein